MKILVIGSAIIDIIMRIDKLPKSGEDVLCKENKVMVGGCAYNVACTLRNLGCEHDLCVPVGCGPYANIIREELAGNQYPILFEHDNKDNGYCLCLVEANGERTFITVQGAESDWQEKWLNGLNMEEYDRVYITGYQVCGDGGQILIDWLKQLKEQTLYFAPGPMICKIDKEQMDAILSLHPVLHINEKELLDFTGQTSVESGLSHLYEQTKNLVIVTMGEKGAVCYDGRQCLEIPGRKAKVVDTIGAGDSHIAAVMGSLSCGKNLKESVALANEVAANIVEVQGAVMTKEEFDKRMGGTL